MTNSVIFLATAAFVVCSYILIFFNKKRRENILHLKGNRENNTLEKHEQYDDTNHNFSEICEEHGYRHEKHLVHTDDSYILRLDRVLPASQTVVKGVVFMMHGIEDSSIEWVINSEPLAPAFILSRAGFDVWLGNNRGNDFSLGHENLTIQDEAYWDFDWEEMGIYDIPAFVNYILQATNKDIIDAYIGHSEGTTQFFAGASLLPEYYAAHIGLFVALAPVVRLDHSTNKAMVYFARKGVLRVSTKLIQTLGLYDLMSSSHTSKWILGKFCGALPRLCQFINQGFVDWSGEVDNLDREADKMAHDPAGSGWRNLIHYGQIIRAKRFQRFDYGEEENQRRYGGSSTPPMYDLTQIQNSIAVYHGDLDALSDPTDVAWLLNESGLPHSRIIHQEMIHAGHNTFSMGKNMTFLSESVIPLIEKIRNNRTIIS